MNKWRTTADVDFSCKQVITIALAVILFDLHITLTNAAGILLTLVGGVSLVSSPAPSLSLRIGRVPWWTVTNRYRHGTAMPSSEKRNGGRSSWNEHDILSDIRHPCWTVIFRGYTSLYIGKNHLCSTRQRL